ncbi:MAG TPA: cytochrome c [Acidimicrobiia bacterium]|jgi:mono/diheme cytochrome c family protein|nr:cytochrome c [Acidimicrobiia bacterium]
MPFDDCDALPLRASRSWRTLAAVTALALLSAACGSETSGDEEDHGIPPQDTELVALGSEIYAGHCAECHGTDLRGTDRGPSHLSEVYEPNHHADGAFILAIQRGSPAHHWRFGDMPRIEGLDGDDIAAVTAYVREQQRIEGFEPYPPP